MESVTDQGEVTATGSVEEAAAMATYPLPRIMAVANQKVMRRPLFAAKPRFAEVEIAVDQPGWVAGEAAVDFFIFA